MNEPSFNDIWGITGLTIDEAEEASSFIVRAVVVDGKPQISTGDYEKARLNVETKNGKIIRILSRG
jgi:hypothetical protein